MSNKSNRIFTKLVAFILALVMVFSNTITGFAASAGSGGGGSGVSGSGGASYSHVILVPIVTVTDLNNVSGVKSISGKKITLDTNYTGYTVNDKSKALYLIPSTYKYLGITENANLSCYSESLPAYNGNNVVTSKRYLYQIDTANIDKEHAHTKADYEKMGTLKPVLKSELNAELGGTSVDTAIANYDKVVNSLKQVKKTKGSDTAYNASLLKFFTESDTIYTGLGGAYMNQYLAPLGLGYAFQCMKNGFNQVSTFQHDYNDISEYYKAEVEAITKNLNLDITEDNPLVVNVSWFAYIWYPSSGNGVDYIALNPADYLLLANTMLKNGKTNGAVPFSETNSSLNQAFLGDTGKPNMYIPSLTGANTGYRDITRLDLATFRANKEAHVGFYNTAQQLNGGNTEYRYVSLTLTGDEYTYKDSKGKAHKARKINPKTDWYLDNGATTTWRTDFSVSAIWSTDLDNPGAQAAAISTVKIDGYNTANVSSSNAELVKKTEDDKKNTVYKVYKPKDTNDVFKTAFNPENLVKGFDGYNYKQAVSIGRTVARGTSLDAVLNALRGYSYKVDYTVRDVEGGTAVVDGDNKTHNLNVGRTVTFNGIVPTSEGIIRNAESDEEILDNTGKTGLVYGKTALNSALIYGYRGSSSAYTNLNVLFNTGGHTPSQAEQVKNALDATYTMVANVGTGDLELVNITKGVKHTANNLTEVDNDYAVALGDVNSRQSGRFVDTTLVYYKPTEVISTMYHANISTRFDDSTGKYYAKVTCTGGDANSTVKYSMENLGQFRLPANTVGVVAIPINQITGKTIKGTQDMSWDATKKAISDYINANVVKSKESEVKAGTDLVNKVAESCKGNTKKFVNGISGGEVFNVGANFTTAEKTNSGVCGYVLVAITAPDNITVKSKTVSDDDNLQDGDTSGKIVVRSYALNKVTADVSEMVTGFKQALYSQTHKYVVSKADKADVKLYVDLNKGESGVTLDNNSYKFNAKLVLPKGRTTMELDNCVTGEKIDTIYYNVRVTHRLNYAQAVTGTRNAGDYYYNTGFKGDDNTGWFGGNFTVSSAFNNNATAKFDTVDNKEDITGNVRNRYTRNTSKTVTDRQKAATNNEKVAYFTYAVETKRKDFGDVLTVSNFSELYKDSQGNQVDMDKAVNDLATVGTDTHYSDKPSENNVSIKGNNYYNKVARLSTVLSTQIKWTSKSGAKLKSDKATELRNLITDGDSCLKNKSGNEWYYYGTHRIPVTNKTADKVSVTGANGVYNIAVTYELTNLGKNLKGATITQYNSLGFKPVHYSVENGTLRGTTDNLYKYTPLAEKKKGVDLYLYGKVESGDGIGTTGKRLSVLTSQRYNANQKVTRITDIVFGKNADYYTPSKLIIATKGRFSNYSGIDANELKGLKTHAYNLSTANNEGKTRGIKFLCTGLSYRQVNLEIEEYCQAYKVSKKDIASNSNNDEIIYKSDSVLMFRDKVVGDTNYSTGESKDSAIKLQYYPEVNMIYYNTKKDAQDDKMITSADDVYRRTIKVVGEQQRQSYSSGLYIYSYSEGLKASNTAERSSDLTINNTDNSNSVSGVTVSSGYQVTTGSKTSKKPTVYAGSDVTLNVEPNFTLNMYGYMLDVTDKSVDGKDDEPEKKVGDNVIAAKNYGYITSGNSLIQDGQLPQATKTTLKSNTHEKYNTVVAGVHPDVYSDWGNYSETKTVSGKTTTTHNADLLKKDFGDWATTMLNPKNYEVSIKLQVKDGNTVSKEYDKFNTSFSKIALVKGGKVGKQSFSATNNVHEDGVYHINIENGDIVRTYVNKTDNKKYYDKYYLALIEQIADDADLSLADADKYFMQSDLHSAILNAIQSSTSDENKSGMTEFTGKKDNKTVDASGLGNDKNWYDEKVKTIVIRRFKTDSVSISGTVLQDKIDYNVTGANNNKTYTGQWYFSLTLKNLNKTGIGTALKNNSENEYTLVKDMQIKDADFDIRNSSVDAGN